MHEIVRDGLKIRSPHPLADYMPALAVGLLKTLGRPQEEYVIFLADFAAAQIKTGHPLVFPVGLAKPAAEMRVQRLLLNPIEVDGVVFLLRTLERRRMRQKSKQLVARVGTLPDEPAAPLASAPANSSAPLGSSSRADALERRVAALEAAFMVGGIPSPSPSGQGPAAPALPDDVIREERFVGLRRRVHRCERNLGRFVRAALAGDPGTYVEETGDEVMGFKLERD